MSVGDKIGDLLAFAEQSETVWPKDLTAGNLPGLTEIEPPPWNAVLGPLFPRGGPSGLVLQKGEVVAEWGEPARCDLTFSIAKSYLSILAGLALGDGLIGSLDERVADRLPGPDFDGPHNGSITWRHLLTMTSEWEGTLWDKPDLVDRNRQLGPDADNSRKGQHRDLQTPGAYWEYNDVRVNLLSLCLLRLFRKPLPRVLKERIMDPIGASDTWSWHGYKNSWVEIAGERMQSVPGGSHWGGGMRINSLDHAKFGQLILNGGVWNGERLLPEGWTDQIRNPCAVNDGYGLLWWLNPQGKEWPSAPANSFAALGAGSNVLWITPDQEIVLVARWIDQAATDGLIGKVMAAFG